MFFQECEKYFSGQLKSYLQNCLDSESNSSNNIHSVRLLMSEDPHHVCMVSRLEEGIFEIRLSKIFLHRLAIFVKCRGAAWESATHNSKLLAFDNDHPYDSHVWDYARDDTYPFGLQVGFKGYLSANYGYDSIGEFADFIERFNSNVDSGFYYLDFQLDELLEKNVINFVRIFGLFLVMHEYAHISSPHSLFLQQWPYTELPRRSAIAGRIFRYRHKAIELDADVRGMLMAFYREFGEAVNVVNLQYFLTIVACGFSIFDLDRRNTLDKRYIDGLYPLPEIRFDALVFALAGWKNKLKKLRDAVIADVIYSAQMLGIFGGPFYLYSGPITSLDKQFTKEVHILGTVRDEMNKIIIQLDAYYRQITNPLPRTGDDWRIDPLGMDEEDFKSAFSEEMIGVFDGKYNDVTIEDVMDERSAEMRRLNEGGIVRKGDHIIIASDNTKELRPEMKVDLKTTSEE